MAEHSHSAAAELGAPMDYQQHERTYLGFLAFSKLLILASIDVLIALALFGFGSGGFWLGVLLLIMMLVGSAVGLAMKASAKPLIGVTIVGVLFFILSVA